MKNIFILAAENSAEKYGALILEQFRQRKKDYNFFGAGGDKFKELGVEILVHSRELSIVGIVEVILYLFRLRRYMHLFLKTAKKKRCDAAILIDFPDFNLRLAKKFKKMGIPVYYYISPTVWAWRYSRIKLIRKYIDHMFLIFPFEVEIYNREKIPFTYTGHPLMNIVKTSMSTGDFKKKYNIRMDKKILALLPGSRDSEISSLLPVMLESVKILNKKFDLKIFLLKANSVSLESIQSFAGELINNIEIIPQSDGYNLISSSDAVLSTCGTSNLETAILGTPFVAVYRVNRLSYLLGIGLLKISNYSIVNILLGEKLIDELIQSDFTVETVAHAVEDILVNKDRINNMKIEFSKLRNMLSLDKDPSEIIFKEITSDLD